MIVTPTTIIDKLVMYAPNNRAVKKTVRFFSVMFIGRATGKRHELICGKLLLNVAIIFYYDVVKQWNWLPREVVELQSLEMLKTWLDAVLGNLLNMTPKDIKHIKLLFVCLSKPNALPEDKNSGVGFRVFCQVICFSSTVVESNQWSHSLKALHLGMLKKKSKPLTDVWQCLGFFLAVNTSNKVLFLF